MKGIVFVELISMAEAAAGETLVDELLDALDLPSGGVYSTVGRYSCSELFAIVGALSTRLETPADELQRQFGHWMHGMFVKNYPDFFKGKTGSFEMLDAIEREVHVEVLKLYPDAELPRFEAERLCDRTMTMRYRSPRALGPFCRGLIEACVEHFNETAQIRESYKEQIEGADVLFEITLEDA